MRYLILTYYRKADGKIDEAIKELKKEVDDLKLGEWQTYPKKQKIRKFAFRPRISGDEIQDSKKRIYF